MILGKNVIAVKQSKEMLDLLFTLGFKIMEVEDCIECIRHTIRFKPDLVIADINSPQLNGLSMARILDTLLIRTPIILTGTDLKYRKHALTFNNIKGFLLNPEKKSSASIDNTKKALESIFFNVENLDLKPVEFSYSFRQREWANLMGKSGLKKILVIEDDSTVRYFILKTLDSLQKFDLYSAEEGLSGVFKALLVEPDLILSDISMPTLDGLAMCQIFNILHKSFPVAFITSIESEEVPKKALKSQGVIGMMEKSVLQDKEIFTEKVNEFIEKAVEMKAQWKKVIQFQTDSQLDKI